MHYNNSYDESGGGRESHAETADKIWRRRPLIHTACPNMGGQGNANGHGRIQRRGGKSPRRIGWSFRREEHRHAQLKGARGEQGHGRRCACTSGEGT